MSDERAPLNETRVRYGLFALAWRRVRYAIRRWWRKATPGRSRNHGDPPTEINPRPSTTYRKSE